MSADHKLQASEVMALASASQAVTRPCTCAIDTFRGWTRLPLEFPKQQMRVMGTLLDDPYQEPTFAEYHPRGTEYWSPEAPIALRHYPTNRSAVLQCRVCGRCCLKYVEAGGYYVEPRIRALDPVLVVDVAAGD